MDFRFQYFFFCYVYFFRLNITTRENISVICTVRTASRQQILICFLSFLRHLFNVMKEISRYAAQFIQNIQQHTALIHIESFSMVIEAHKNMMALSCEITHIASHLNHHIFDCLFDSGLTLRVLCDIL